MKNALLTLAALAVSSTMAGAATLVFTTNSGDTSNAIVSSTGAAFQTTGATVRAGFFTTLSDGQVAGITSGAELLSAFTTFGGASAGFVAGGPPTSNFRGYFTLSPPSTAIGGSVFDTKNIYLLVQNNLTEEYLVLKSDLTFTVADDPTLPNVTKTFTSANTSVIIGGFNNFTAATRNQDVTSSASWNTVALVPEPSAALLGLIGLVGLLRRRR